MSVQSVQLDGKPYVIFSRDEYDRLTTLAKAADLPPLPEPNASDNYPAIEYARAVWPARSSATAWPLV